MLEFFGILGSILATIGIIPYIKDILYGNTRPQKATWLIWVLLGSIAFFSQLAKGATNSLWMTGLETIGQLVVLVLALKVGTGKFQKKDYVALFIAGLGLIFWYATHEAAIALYIVIAIDFTGTILTIQKAYQHPQTETLSIWILSTFGGFFTILSVGNWNIILLSYPIFIFVMNGIISGAILLGRQKKYKKR